MPESNVQTAAEAFRDSLQTMVATIASAIAQYESTPASGSESMYRKWKDTALKLLSTDLHTVNSCFPDVSSPRGKQLLLATASIDMGLAKHLDSFQFDFAGPVCDKSLNDAVDQVTEAASNVVSALAAQT